MSRIRIYLPLIIFFLLACTAVVTELAYHEKPTIEADVSFLSELEWRQEMTILLQDLVDEDGNIKRSTDLKSDAGIAWQKVRACYSGTGLSFVNLHLGRFTRCTLP